MNNPFENRLLPAVRNGGYKDDNYWIWCGSAIVGDDGRYHLFASRWEKKYGFSANWLYRCEIVRCASDTPEGPYQYEETVLSARSAAYFDGRNVHNPCIRESDGHHSQSLMFRQKTSHRLQDLLQSILRGKPRKQRESLRRLFLPLRPQQDHLQPIRRMFHSQRCKTRSVEIKAYIPPAAGVFLQNQVLFFQRVAAFHNGILSHFQKTHQFHPRQRAILVETVQYSRAVFIHEK